jgi:hypothetical protein
MTTPNTPDHSQCDPVRRSGTLRKLPFWGLNAPPAHDSIGGQRFLAIRDLTRAISIKRCWVACAYEVSRDDPTNSM